MPIFRDYAKFYNLIYSDKPYRQEAEFVYKWAGKPKTILEIGCGTGKHIYYLAPKVKQIIGTDASLEMLSWAYIHTKKFNNVRYIFNKTDKKLLDLPKVDCVIALFNVIGYCLLEECLPYLPLKKDKYFIFDAWSTEKSRKDLPILKIKFIKDKCYRIAIPIKRKNDILELDYVIVDKETVIFEKHFIKSYSKNDIEKLCKKYGYKIAGIKRTKTWTIWYKLTKL